MDSLMSAQIKQTLFNTYQIDLSIKSIQELNFGKLQQLDNSNTLKSDRKSFEIETLTPDDTGVHDPLGNNLHKLLFLHTATVEENIDLMTAVATYFSVQVCRLQCSQNCKFKTLHEYSTFYGKLIRQKQPIGPYIFCGFSYDLLLALEICSFLETKGENARVICIDSTTENTRLRLEEEYQHFHDSWNIIQQDILTNFAKRFPNTDKSKVRINFNLTKSSLI